MKKLLLLLFFGPMSVYANESAPVNNNNNAPLLPVSSQSASTVSAESTSTQKSADSNTPTSQNQPTQPTTTTIDMSATSSVGTTYVNPSVAAGKRANKKAQAEKNYEEDLKQIVGLSDMKVNELFDAGKVSYDAHQYNRATRIFNHLLGRVNNEFTKDALEYLGMSREGLGEFSKARSEYKTYIFIYRDKDPEGVARVQQKLDLIKDTPDVFKYSAGSKDKKKKSRYQETLTGGVSQYYYGGISKNTNVDADGNKTISRSNDQNMIISNFDITYRVRDGDYDTKFVYRDTQSHNMLPGTIDKNNYSAFFMERTDKEKGYYFKLGRQSGSGNGVLGRFDGILGKYTINDKWKVVGVYGKPDNGSQNSVETKRHFYGVGVEIGPIAQNWMGDAYLIQQIADGIAERRAIGGTVRYNNGPTSLFVTTDYDTIYRVFNSITAQANFPLGGGFDASVMFDHRKSPLLYAESALQCSTGATSVGQLLTTFSREDLIRCVKGIASDSDMAMVSVTKRLNDKWGISGTINANKMYSSDGFSDLLGNSVEASPGQDTVYTYTLQAQGSGIILSNNNVGLNYSYIDDPTFSGKSYAFSHSVPLNDKWRLDTSIRYYTESRDNGNKSWSLSPSVKVGYKLKDNVSLEASYDATRTHVDDNFNASKSDNTRQMLFIGYRWDFR